MTSFRVSDDGKKRLKGGAWRQGNFPHRAPAGGVRTRTDAARLGIAAPAVPAGFAAVAGTEAVALSWSLVPGAIQYKVKRGLSAAGPFTTVAIVTGTSHNDTGLAAGTQYHYVVTAENQSGGSTQASVQSATPASAIPSYTKFRITLTGVGDNNNWQFGADSGRPQFGAYASNDASGTNLFVGKVDTVTNTGTVVWDGAQGAFATTGGSNRPYGAQGATITVNLTSAVAPGSFYVDNYIAEAPRYQITSFQIHGSNDGSNWTLLSTVTDCGGITDVKVQSGQTKSYHFLSGSLGTMFQTAGNDASLAFDNDPATYWGSTAFGTTPSNANEGVGKEFTSGRVLKAYGIRVPANDGNAPDDWEFQGSNNGSTWTTLDTRTVQGANLGSNFNKVLYYPIATGSQGSYSQYRIRITKRYNGNYARIAELRLLG